MPRAPVPEGVRRRKRTGSPELEFLGALQLPFPNLPFAELQCSNQLERLGSEPRLGFLRLLELAADMGPAACVRDSAVPGFGVGGVGLVAVREQRALEVAEQVGDGSVPAVQPEGEVDFAAVPAAGADDVPEEERNTRRQSESSARPRSTP
ncbi:MAG: hypothetical protein OXN84_14085 [Albidovulum sp.]|nr:hypothetical protein [Albidovulum sp.]